MRPFLNVPLSSPYMSNNNQINILLCIDLRFTLPLAVLINSILKNPGTEAESQYDTSQEFNFFIYSKSDELPQIEHYINVHLIPVISISGVLARFRFHYHAIENCRFYKEFIFKSGQMLRNVKSYLTEASLYRILAINDLAGTIDKVLYLDADIICNGSLHELYNTDLSYSYVAAVPESQKFTECFMNDNPSWDHSYYFNSGVMLINLFRWHQDNITEQLINYMINSETLDLPDQDALNFVLPDKMIVYLPKKYNALVIVDPELKSLLPYNLVVIHFANYKKKPWKPDSDLSNSWNRLYQSHMEQLESNRKYWWSLWPSDKYLWFPQSSKDYKMMTFYQLKKLRIISSLYGFAKYLQLKISSAVRSNKLIKRLECKND